MKIYSPLMQIALDIAENIENEIPVVALIARKSEVIACSGNKIITDNDPTAHAEIVAIRKAASKLNTYNLSECDLYTTLEPCPMCAYAISLARINKLYFAAYDEKRGAVSSNNIFENKCTFHSPEVYDGIMEEQSKRILDRFFQKLRK